MRRLAKTSGPSLKIRGSSGGAKLGIRVRQGVQKRICYSKKCSATLSSHSIRQLNAQTRQNVATVATFRVATVATFHFGIRRVNTHLTCSFCPSSAAFRARTSLVDAPPSDSPATASPCLIIIPWFRCVPALQPSLRDPLVVSLNSSLTLCGCRAHSASFPSLRLALWRHWPNSTPMP